ncbi:MAG: 4-hydroxy-tetrahydrodipicolinate reductase [Clostridiales bacterium]|nr:4-hydroxy-tetrahydrodipicolinate reductase [Clostridiales bacterium]
MKRIILSGCSGKMGKAITECVATTDDCEIVAGVDIFENSALPYPVFLSFSELNIEADVIIDFSHPSALSSVLKYAVDNSVPAVVATTGLSDEQIAQIHEASQKVAVFRSANMSLGVNLVCELAKTAARVLGEAFDIEIVEMHHNQKLDAPSGTALMIADEIKTVLDDDVYYEYDRHSKREKRSKSEIGIHALRGGTVTGEHEIIFAGHDELVKISHSARSKEIFAQGAVNAAKFICEKSAALYTMKDLVKS